MPLNSPASFVIEVANTGNVPLTNIQVRVSGITGCDDSIAGLGVGSTAAVICNIASVTQPITASVRVTGSAEGSLRIVVATGQATITPTLTAITGVAWEDTNGDGIRGVNEPMLSGVSVRLVAVGGGSAVAQTATNSSGSYTFAGIQPGKYMVEVDAPEGYAITQPNQGNDDTQDSDVSLGAGRTSEITVASGETVSHVDAGFIRRDGGGNAIALPFGAALAMLVAGRRWRSAHRPR